MTAPFSYSELAEAPLSAERSPTLGIAAQAAPIVYRVSAVGVPVLGVLFVAGLTGRTLFAGALAGAAWFLALRRVLSRPWLSPPAISTATATGFATLSGLAALSIVAFWLPAFGLTENQLVIMAAGVFLASTLEAGRKNATSPRRLVIVGADRGVRELLAAFKGNPELPFEVVGVVNDERDASPDASPWLGTMRELGSVIREERPDLVVLGTNIARGDAVSQVLDIAALDVQVVDSRQLHELALGKVAVHHVSAEWFMAVLHFYRRPYPRIAKRAFDLLVVAVALLVAAPLLGIVALVLHASRSGPVFFRQLRLGEGGRTFEILKFRTMIDGAEPDGVAVWAKEGDPRVTRIGHVLRRTRLDELPQLWNVLRGDMSIVGPRPERPEFLELLNEAVPFWTRRTLVKPGITGWAQIRRGYASDVDGTAEKLAYDLYYLRHRSLLFDLAILSRTVGIVLTGFGSR
jgi:exopolysaccharide biosynthesis polyprenyl glycosylphosphotransferase